MSVISCFVRSALSRKYCNTASTSKTTTSKLDNKDLFKVNEHRKTRGLPPYKDLKALREEIGCYVAFGKTPKGLANLLSHEVAKLGSVKVVPQGGGS